MGRLEFDRKSLQLTNLVVKKLNCNLSLINNDAIKKSLASFLIENQLDDTAKFFKDNQDANA